MSYMYIPVGNINKSASHLIVSELPEITIVVAAVENSSNDSESTSALTWHFADFPVNDNPVILKTRSK